MLYGLSLVTTNQSNLIWRPKLLTLSTYAALELASYTAYICSAVIVTQNIVCFRLHTSHLQTR